MAKRVTVYVPDDIAKAMKAVKKHKPNWSQVAQQAFAAKAKRLGATV